MCTRRILIILTAFSSTSHTVCVLKTMTKSQTEKEEFSLTIV